MRLLIISDTHGDEQTFKHVVLREDPDQIIHCGDFCIAVERLPQLEILTVVRGNCDRPGVPDEALWEGAGLRFLVAHGHQYGIKSSLAQLSYRAEEVAANVVCFGHSHLPLCVARGGALFINPGSLVAPRGFPEPTYAVLEAESGKVKVAYFTPEGERVNELGGTFRLKK